MNKMALELRTLCCIQVAVVEGGGGVLPCLPPVAGLHMRQHKPPGLALQALLQHGLKLSMLRLSFGAEF